ncbi:unnamed protein product [Absidia cylindrospora]
MDEVWNKDILRFPFGILTGDLPAISPLAGRHQGHSAIRPHLCMDGTPLSQCLMDVTDLDLMNGIVSEWVGVCQTAPR